MITDKEITEQIKKCTLDRIPFTFGNTYPKDWLKDVTVEQFIDRVSGDLAIRIKLDLPGVGEHKIRTYPRTRWDALKERIFPKWILRIFPPKYTDIHHIVINKLYP